MSRNHSNPLGKGLGALLPSFDLEEEDPFSHPVESPFSICPLDKISPNRAQPRKDIDPDKLRELADSIREKGILQPLVVARDEAGNFELIAGERRWRAAQLAGMTEAPVIIKEILREEDRLELALIENIQRQNLNPMDEAISYQRLHQEFSLTQEEIAKRVGKERSTITNFMRLLQLPEEMRQHLANNRISAGHARALLSLTDNSSAMQHLCEEIILAQLSVREAEELAKKLKTQGLSIPKKQPTPKQAKSAPLPPSYCKTLCTNLDRVLGTKSRIIQNGSKGKLEIEYSSPDDLERLLSMITK